LKSNIVKTAFLEDKVTIAQWETLPNVGISDDLLSKNQAKPVVI